MSDNVQKSKLKAVEARQKALSIREPKLKAELLRAAQEWDELAKEIEACRTASEKAVP